MKHSFEILTVLLFSLFLSQIPDTSIAQNYIVRSKFYAGMDAGVGMLNLSRNDLPSQRSNPFALGFYGGYMPLKWLRTGIILGGWLLEPYNNNDPSKGLSLENIYAQIQALPFKKCDIYLSFAGGFSNYINMHPDEYRANGSGILAGLGYEKGLAWNIGISLMINYGFGSFNDVIYPGISVKNQHYDVTEFLIGITYHIIPKKQLYRKEKLRHLDEPGMTNDI